MFWFCFTYLFDVQLCSSFVLHIFWCTTVLWLCFTYLVDVRLCAGFALHICLMYDCVLASFYRFCWCTTVFWLTCNKYIQFIWYWHFLEISQWKVIISRWKCKKIPELSTLMFLYEIVWRNHTANQVAHLRQFQCFILETWHACTFGMQVLKYILTLTSLSRLLKLGVFEVVQFSPF